MGLQAIFRVFDGLQFSIETDHKPLVPLFGSKLLDKLPIRVQRFRMRMMRFNFNIYHIPGKNLTIADMLSRASYSRLTKDDNLLPDETDAYVQVMIQTLPATENRLEEIKRRQEDKVCKQIVKYCPKGWPSIKSIPQTLKKFYPVAAELSVQNGLLLRGRLVIPVSMQREILKKLHVGHQDMPRAKQAVWWPGISKQIEKLVSVPNASNF